MKLKSFFALILCNILIVSASWAATYNVDKDHSAVTFKIRHLFSNVQGNFNDFKGTLEYEAGKPESWKAKGEIVAASIDTNVPERDKHLRNADFFDVEKFPAISFETTKVSGVQGNKAMVEGLFTMHGVQKPITLNVEIHGEGKDPWGNQRLGLTATTKINRKDFGIVWNKVLDTGGAMLGEEVDVTIEVEGIAA